jgi:hypothetical protein
MFSASEEWGSQRVFCCETDQAIAVRVLRPAIDIHTLYGISGSAASQPFRAKSSRIIRVKL